ncbi:MAG: alpha/beta fold hydrolase [Chloroflexota bacterium]
MPALTINGTEIYYEEHGTGPETIIFAHGLLWSGDMFAPQIAALKDRYRCITFDFRGQGRSEITRDGYDMDTLSEDATALIKALDGEPCHFVGLSMGGFVGMRLAIRHPELLQSLVLLETSADPEPRENIPRYRLLALITRWFGPALVANQVMPIMFGQSFLNDPDRAELRAAWRLRLIANNRVGITRAIKGVIERKGVYEDLGRIALPTLIIVGDQDVATVPAKSERIHAQIPHSQLVIIPNAGHTATIEEPEAVSEALQVFFNTQRR